MPFRWAMVGNKFQTLMILQALAKKHILPEFLVVLPNMPEDERALFLEFSECYRVPVFHKPDRQQQDLPLSALDFLLVCRFDLLPKSIFAAPRLGSFNIHSSLLPQYRGVHPVSWCLIRGEQTTGVTLHCINEGIDTGDILMQKKINIADEHDIHSLTAELNYLSAELCLEFFAHLHTHGTLPVRTPQTGSYEYARRRTLSDSQIVWQQHTAKEIWNMIRALQAPYPNAYAHDHENRKVAFSNAKIINLGKSSYQIGAVLARLGRDDYLIQCLDAEILLRTTNVLKVGSILQ